MAGKRGKSKCRRRHTTVNSIKAEELKTPQPVILIEIVSREAMFNEEMVDVWNLPSSSDSTQDEGKLQKGVVYQILVNLAYKNLQLEKIPGHEDLKDAIAFAFRRHYEKKANR